MLQVLKSIYILKWLDDDVREVMIGKVEQAKTDRINFLNGIVEKNEVD